MTIGKTLIFIKGSKCSQSGTVDGCEGTLSDAMKHKNRKKVEGNRNWLPSVLVLKSDFSTLNRTLIYSFRK